MVKVVKNENGVPARSKNGSYIFTNGSAYFTLSLDDFKRMRACLAEVETSIEKAYWENMSKKS